MAAFNKFQQFVEDVAKGVHNLSTGSMKVTLTTAAAAPVATNSVLADITQIASIANAGDLAVTTTSCEQTTGTVKLILVDKVITATGSCGPFRYVVLYNDTPTSPADPLIGWYDYGSEITLATGETLTIDFDGSNGVLTIA